MSIPPVLAALLPSGGPSPSSFFTPASSTPPLPFSPACGELDDEEADESLSFLISSEVDNRSLSSATVCCPSSNGEGVRDPSTCDDELAAVFALFGGFARGDA